MISRTLSRRLRQLEARLQPARKDNFQMTVQFIEPGTMAVVSKLMIEDGQQSWWYAPGHEPLESCATGTSTGLVRPDDPR